MLLQADASALHTVLGELLGNAARAAGVGGFPFNGFGAEFSRRQSDIAFVRHGFDDAAVVGRMAPGPAQVVVA